MLYFVNFNMPVNKSGIEHAQLKRIALFKAHQVPAKIVTRDYDPQLHYNLKYTDLTDDDILNEFDYFQDATHVPVKEVSPDDIKIPANIRDNLVKKWVADQNYYEYYHNQAIFMRIAVFPNTQQVAAVHYFDTLQNLYRVDYYDRRGFVSKEQYYTPDNKVNMEQLLRPDGSVAVQQFYRFDRSMKRSTSQFRVVDYNGKDYEFNTISELLRFCLDELARQDPQVSIFVSDRSLVDDWSIMHMQEKAYKVLHLHNSQTNDANDPMHSGLNYNYELGLNNLDKWNAIITATKKQADNVAARFKPHIPIFVIPVGVVPTEVLTEKRIPMSQRTAGKVIAVARISNEKRLDDLVRAVGQARESVPNITLDIYGYENSENDYAEPKKVRKIIKDLGLTDVVKLKGYTNNLLPVYQNAQVFGLTSRMEGFNLSLLEAISHGVVGETYDVNYGPNSIVKDGINGHIVTLGNWHQMANNFVKLFKNPDLLQKLSDGAYQSAEEYSPDNIWATWINLIQDANQKIATVTNQ
ncbi:glycosyltransferase [Lentilactobacillus sp. IMAU92037]|uniref:glycosyltransferase n=1 Tax=Lentilactobacillus TaxID=2767893 RepID=UPI001C251834|nr:MULTISPECIES: glycosyltransferase [Lentilactobacillus]MBU9789699.1 glycosyltransferase [Lentilactobacillus dabitei]MBV0930056.1 glycosyltransferase [Lentilactobacillus dabitei]MDM7516594.1 glycosyltransferase [Lentilactobacillus sp. TOM.63]